MKKWFILLMVLGFVAVLLPAGVAAEVSLGGDEAWYTIHTNVQAQISFDGTYKGTTSGGQLSVPVYTTATPYSTVTATASGYQTASQSLPSITKGETVPVYLTLQLNPTPVPTPVPTPSNGWASVSSYPTKAEIWVDGSYKGLTDMTTGLSPGTHNLELRKDGYNNYFQGFTVYTGSTTPISVTLTPKTPSTGTVMVSSSPAGGKVYIGGSYKGVTPSTGWLTVANVAAGSQNVQVSLSGYQTFVQTITLSGGQSFEVNAHLTPNAPTSGSLQITSSPSGAQIYLNNQNSNAITPYTATGLQPGYYTVTLRLPGYQEWSQSFEVLAGQSTPVTATLTSTAQPTKSPLGLPALIGALGIALAFIALRVRKD